MQDQAGDQRLGFLVPMRLARFAGGVIDQCVGQRHAVVGEIEAGRVDTIQWIERGPDHARYAEGIEEIGRAHVRTPVTNAHIVCRLLLEKQKTEYTYTMMK